MKRRLFKFLYVLLIIAFIAFIFSNSLDSMSDSAEKSGRILKFVNGLLEKINFPILFSETFVRKAAHFLEFFILGTILFGYSFYFSSPDLKSSVYCSYVATLTAMGDETIQYFTDRGSMLLDVWLDTGASAFAVFLLFLLYKTKKSERKDSLWKN